MSAGRREKEGSFPFLRVLGRGWEKGEVYRTL